MKVSELIEILSKYPQDAEVVKYSSMNDYWSPNIIVEEWGINDDNYKAEDFQDGTMRDYFIEIS